ncbi:MAG: hypothetical protein JNK78_10595 [Planctomycetes bacterium]|nr:hypothetical protein [Planctomycetota bacterium]
MADHDDHGGGLSEFTRRVLLYGTAALLLGGLGVAWATKRSEADVVTLLSSADVQLRLAHAIPPKDKDGVELSSRAAMIADAEKSLEIVERLEPGKAVTAEFQGFARMLRGDYEGASAAYARALQCADCGDEQRDVLVFNRARVLAQAGHRAEALEVFAAAAAALDARFGPQRSLEEATILRQLGRRVDAEKRLDQVVRDTAVAPMASLQAGIEYLALGHDDKAEAALVRASSAVPIADYHLARLKLRRGEVDTSLQLLERVSKVVPAEVRRLLRDEADAWRSLAELPRFRELSAERAATPGR